MADTTHDIAGLVKKANAITRHPSMGGAMGHAQDVLSDMSAALTALQAERDAWKARAEAAEAVVRFGVDLIEGDSFGSEWKKGCADFRRKARALPVPADLEKRVRGEP